MRRIAKNIALTLMLFVLLLSGAAARRVHPQHNSANIAAIQQKKSELAHLRGQINEYQKQLDVLAKTEHSSAKALEAYTAQTHLLRNLIAELNSEEQRLTDDITETQHEISSSQETLQSLKRQYARAVVALYKRGFESGVEVLLNSGGINEALERSEYFRQFTIYRQRLAENIKYSVEELQDQQNQLTKQRTEKESLANERQQEEQQYAARASERTALIAKIRSDKSALKETLAKAKQSSRAIESLITNLIEREAQRKKNESHASIAKPKSLPRGRVNKDKEFDDIAKESAEEETAPDNTGFGALRGALRWPCAGRRIAEHYGERVNPTLGTVTVNPGIDIATPKNSDVTAVAEGEVSLVYWLPSFGTIIIVDHQNGYRTVIFNDRASFFTSSKTV